MERRFESRRPIGAMLTAVLALAALIVAVPAHAQGGRMRVLVPTLEPQNGAPDNFGDKVADELRKRLDNLPTHAPVAEKEVKEALRKFKIKEDDLNCVLSRQLAVQIAAELVMCGEYQAAGGAMQVTARFVNARTGDDFIVPPFNAGDPKDAAAQIFTAFDTFQNQLRLTTFGLEYMGSSQWPNAVENCRKAAELNPQSVPALYCVARSLMEMDSLETSLASHRQVLEVNPIHQDALLTAGIVATRLSQQDVARDYFNQYLELNPNNVDVRLKVATDMHKAGDPAGAMQVALKGLEQAPDNITLAEYVGHFAMAAAQKATEGTGANGDVPPEVANYYRTALEHYTKVFQQKGQEADPLMLRNMVLVNMQLGQTDDAVALGAQAVQAKADNAPLWATYADALQRAGKLSEAVAALERVGSIDPTYPNLAAKRGLWYLQSGEVSKAREAFRTALSAGQIGGDDVANMLFAYGYNEKFQKGQQMQAVDFFKESAEFATSAELKARSTFWVGYVLFTRAIELQKPSTVASAQQTLPMFREAAQMFRNSSAYREQASKLPALIEQSNTYIEIQEALIKRGR